MLSAVERVLVSVWALTLAVGVLPTVIPGVEAVQTAVGSIVPHAVHRPVMFATVPEQVWTARVKVAGDEGWSSLTDVVKTKAFGYGNGRTHLNFLIVPKWLHHLCRTIPRLDGATIEVRRHSLVRSNEIFPSQTLRCQGGTLTGGDSSRL